MQRIMLKSKIHRATLTGADLNYEGSITLDEDLLERADILPGEQVQALNISNGARFVTYALRGARGSGIVGLNGAAARLGEVGDKVIILSYCHLSQEQAEKHRAKIIFVDEDNKPRE